MLFWGFPQAEGDCFLPVWRKAYWAYVGLVWVGAIVSTSLAFARADDLWGSSEDLAIFLILSVGSQFWQVRSLGTSISANFMIFFPSNIILGPASIPLMVLANEMVMTALRGKRPVFKIVFSVGEFLFLGSLANLLHGLWILPYGEKGHSVLGVVFLGAVMSGLNILLTNTAIALSIGVTFRSSFSLHTLWLPFYFLTSVFLASLIHFLHSWLSFGGTLIGIVPLALFLLLIQNQARIRDAYLNRLLAQVSEPDESERTLASTD